MSTEEPKKKRRQNVACSCCKIRRIKCDLSNLLYSLPTSSISPIPPLNQLVEQHPEIECTNCKKKGLKCDTSSIREPTKPNKGGKRIDELKKKFGQSQDKDDGQIDDNDARTSNFDHDVNSQSEGYGFNQKPEQIPFDPLQFFNDNPMNPDQPSQLYPTDLTTVPTSELWTKVNHSNISVASLFESSLLKSLNFDIPPSSSASTYQDAPPIIDPQDISDQTINLPNSSSGNLQEAASIWQQFANNRKEAMDLVRTTGLTPGADSGQLGENYMNFDGDLQDRVLAQLQSAQSSTYNSPSRSQIDREILNPLNGRINLPFLSSTPTATATSRNFVETPSSGGYSDYSIGDSRKRSRSPFINDDKNRKIMLMSNNPWKLYSKDSQSQLIHWSRREVVSEQLADRALGMALSNHLVKTFFQAVHLSYPAISPEAFYLDWARAGQRSDRMTPAQEALCAVIEAWGARYSDSPVVLGLSEAKAHAAPRVILADGTFAPGTRARTHWGKARLAACKALMDRAKRLIDENGIYRQPSITGVQALTLFSQLMHMTDEKVLDKDHWLQNRMIHSTIIEQMQILGLMWDTDGPIVIDDDEATLSFSQLQMKQRRLFWTHMVGDAFFSASIGMLPKISQEDVDSAGEWIETVQDRLPHSSFKLLAFFLSVYHRLGLAGRDVASKVAYPLRRKGAADVGKICMTVRKVWKDVRDIHKDINTKVSGLLESCRKDDLLGFSPLNFLANLRLSCPFLLLVIHQLIRDQLEFWKTCQVSSAFISTPSENTTPSTPFSSRSGQKDPPSKRNIELLERLNRESVDGLLSSCRGQIRMLESIIPTGVIQSASILLRVLIATAQLLAEVPTNEQGYPNNTPGGLGWTWETKQKEIDICLEALHQVGWAWADVGDVSDSVALTMERMIPTSEQLAAWKAKQATENDTSEDIIRMKEAEAQASETAVSAVLQFWPPVSIPQLIEKAINENPKTIDSGIPNMTNHLQQPRFRSNNGQSDAAPPPAPSARFMREGNNFSNADPVGPVYNDLLAQHQQSNSNAPEWMAEIAQSLNGETTAGQANLNSFPELPQALQHNYGSANQAQINDSHFEPDSQDVIRPPQSLSQPPINLQSVLHQPIVDFESYNNLNGSHFNGNIVDLSQISDPQTQNGLQEQQHSSDISELDVQAFLDELGIPQGPIFPHNT